MNTAHGNHRCVGRCVCGAYIDLADWQADAAKLLAVIAERDRQLAEAREAAKVIDHAPACLLYGGAKCDCGVEALERALAGEEKKL